jgi:hypothetical protein
MPRTRPRSPLPFDLAEAQQLRLDGLSYHVIAKRLNTNFNAIYRTLNANGTPSAPPTLERTPIIGESVGAPPEYPSTPAYDVLVQRVDAHDRRFDVIEALMQALQQQPAYLQRGTPSVPEYTAPREWKKSGAEFAADIPDELRAYAKTHGLQVREVMGIALRECLGAHDAPLPAPNRMDKEVGGE